MSLTCTFILLGSTTRSFEIPVFKSSFAKLVASLFL
jgi:hypothetical protein